MALSPKQKQAASWLAKGMPPKELAELLSVSLRTLQRWRNQPEFKAQMQSVEVENSGVIAAQVVENADLNEFAATLARTQALMSRGIDILEHVLSCPDSRVADQLRVVSMLAKWHGLEGGFERGVSCLRSYGLVVFQDRETGKWELWDQRWKDENIPQNRG